MNKKTKNKKHNLQRSSLNQARPARLKREAGPRSSTTSDLQPQTTYQEKEELMPNRAIAQEVEKYLVEVGHIRAGHRGYMQTLDALTGNSVTCKLGRFNGERAVAMVIGVEANQICLTRSYIGSVLKRSMEHSQLSLVAPRDDSPNTSTTIDPTSGLLMEAALITIEGEELIELFVGSRAEPIVLEPGFLVELMLELYK